LLTSDPGIGATFALSNLEFIATPERAIDCGLPFASSIIVTVPRRRPSALGLKPTETVQLALGARMPAHAPVWMKSPDTETLCIVTGRLPVFLIEIRFGGLVVRSSPNETLWG
jgi:hypothetical protein